MKRNPYQTILVIVTGFLIIGFLIPSLRLYFFYTASAIGFFGLLSQMTRNWIIWIWEKLSLALGCFNSRILLSVVFIFFLTPIAFLYRLFKGDTMRIKRKPDGSNFVERNHLYNQKDLENPW
jgi:hypothetical protein